MTGTSPPWPVPPEDEIRSSPPVDFLEWIIGSALRSNDPGILQRAQQHHISIHAHNNLALRRAAIAGNLKIIQWLVENGADVHASDDDAICEAAARGHLQIVKFLYNHGADINAQHNAPLAHACQNGHRAVAAFCENPVKTTDRLNKIVNDACAEAQREAHETTPSSTRRILRALGLKP